MKKLITILMLVMLASLAFGQLTNELIRSCEDEILSVTKNQYEMLIVLSDEGNIILKKIGDRNSISLTSDENDLIYGAAVLIHNHPSSTNLSPEDMAIAIKLNIREIRALAPNSIYGYGSWVMINDQNKDKQINNQISFGFYFSMSYGCMNAFYKYTRNLSGSLVHPEASNYITRHIGWMQMAQFSNSYKSGKIRFYFETKDFKCIRFDKAAYILGSDIDI